MDRDVRIRAAAVRHCRRLSLTWGEAIPASELGRGFVCDGEAIKLKGIQGVFKPRQLTDGPLTLLSTLASSYEDEDLDGDEMLYDYAPASREYENDGLKRVAELGRGVILLKQVRDRSPVEYMLFAPVAVLGFDDAARKFRLGLRAASEDDDELPAVAPRPFSKAYAHTVTRARLHQAHFRRATLAAYRTRCCICALRERRLLDAAHIVDDRLPEGIAEVRNGMAMCPTHHRAYDRGILLVDDRYKIDVRSDRVKHVKDPQTKAVLLDHRGRSIHLPRSEAAWPDPELLRVKLDLSG